MAHATEETATHTHTHTRETMKTTKEKVESILNLSSKAGQIAMCYDASRHATIQGMAKFIAGLNAERSALVSKWRENGKADSGWLAIEELDKVIDSQENVLMSLEGSAK